MKTLIASDIHLGDYSYGIIDQETGLNSRLLDINRAFLEVIDYAITNKVDKFIIAGDVYHLKHPKSHIRKLFAEAIRKLLENNISTIIIPGNHDQTVGLGKSHAFSEMQELSKLFKNLQIIENPEIVKLDEDNEIAFLPFVNRASFNLLDEDEFHKWNVEAITNLSNKIKGKNRIFIGHFGTDKSAMGGSSDVGSSNPRLISLSFLESTNFTKLYLGDIHKHQLLSSKTRHIGSVAQVTFGEENEPKGFYLINDGAEDFIEVKSPQFLTFYKDLTGDCREKMQELVEEIQEVDLKNRIVRVKVDIKEEDLISINFNGIKTFLKEESYIFLDVFKNIITISKSQDDLNFDELSSFEDLLKMGLEQENLFDEETFQLGMEIFSKVK